MRNRANAAVARVAQAIVATAAVFAWDAAAQSAAAPDIKVGDRWQFVVWYTVPSATPNRTWVVTGVTSKTIEGTENGEPLLLTRELNVLDSPASKNSNPRGLSFPLEVGKRWRYVNDWVFKPKGSKGGASVEAAVVAYEQVTVPAGEFDAFKLTSTERLSGTSPINSRIDAEVVRTYWYAPQARIIVKTVTRHPYLGPSTVELVSMDLRR